MRSVESLSHTRCECKWHIVFIPKYRRKAIFGQIRRDLGEVFKRLARQKESVIEEGLLYPTLDRATFFILCRLGREEFSRIIGHVERT